MTLARWQRYITDQNGNIRPGAYIEVRKEAPGSPLVNIYTDRNGTNLSANPFQTDPNGDGLAYFHAYGGAYQIRAYTLDGFEAVWRYVGVGKGGESDLGFTRPSGKYAAGTTYGTGDFVYYNGSLFVSRVDGNIGHTPDATTPGDTTYWMYTGPAIQGPGANDLHFAASDENTPISVGTGKTTVRAVGQCFAVEVRASLTLPASGSPVVVDILKNGVSMLSTKLSIDAGEKTSKTAATPAVISSPLINDDDELRVDVISTGSGATGLKIALISAPN